MRCSGWAAAGAQGMRPARIRGGIWRRWKRRSCSCSCVRQEISYRHTDLALLFRRLKQEGLVTGGSFRSLCPPPDLTRPERDCFIECFSGLGRTEAEQECQRLAFYQERFTLFLQQAQEHARPQLELSHKLGFAAGLAAAILCL